MSPLSTTIKRRPFFSAPFFALPAAFALGYLSYRYNSNKHPATPINPYDFSPYTVTASTPLSPSSALITLTPRLQSNPPPHFWPTIHGAGIWSVQVKQPQLQIQRQYTPLPSSLSTPNTSTSTQDNDDAVTLFVRAVPGGEVSRFLLARIPGDTIDLRGPVITHPWPQDTKGPYNVLFLAGGTGVSPALQVARHLLSLPAIKDTPHTLTVLYAARSSAETPPPHLANLQALDSPSLRVSVRYFHDDRGTFISPADVDSCLSTISNSSTTTRSTGTNKKEQVEGGGEGREGGGRGVVMVSGPEGFVSHWAGPKGWKDGEETQGPLGGVIGEILRRRKMQLDVVKL